MPGPLFAAVLAGVAASGFWAGPALVLGHGLLELVVVLALARGLGTLLARPAVTRVVAGTGGLVLLWLAYSMVRDGLAQRVVLAGGGPPVAAVNPVVLGALVSASNPYWVLWWATAGAGYVALALRQGAAGIGAVFTGHISSDLAWYTLVAAAVAAGRDRVNPAVYNGIVAGAGAFLFIMGALFLAAAVRWRATGSATAPPSTA